MTTTIFIIVASLLSLGAGSVLLLRQRQRRARILAEDALKHLFHCESSGVACTLISLAGAIGHTADTAARVVRDLARRNLVVPRGSEVTLTPAGRADALRVIRVHRLWERHLADETTVGELDWHKEAEHKEHVLSREQTEDLAKRLGHPVYDPHGDPIPSPAGGLPRATGAGLEAFDEGDVVRIVHVEDEPATVYKELVEAGLYPGLDVTIREKSDQGIVLEYEGKIAVLPAVTAGNLRVEPGTKEARTGPRPTLASLPVGHEAVVSGISPACRGLQRRRLMDLGLVPGTKVRPELRGAAGDPIAYRIRGAVIALRKEHAEWIYVDHE